MAITERPDAANDDTAPRAEPAQPAAPYVDCVTPMPEQPEAPPGDAPRSTGWPEEFIGGCRFGDPEMAWPDDDGKRAWRVAAVVVAVVVAAIAAGVIVLVIVLRSVIG